MPVQTRLGRAIPLTKPHDDTLLVGLHAIEPAEHPQTEQDQTYDYEAAAAADRHQTPQVVLTLAD